MTIQELCEMHGVKRAIKLVNDPTIKELFSKDPRTGKILRDLILEEYKSLYNYKAVAAKLGLSEYYVQMVVWEEGVSRISKPIPESKRNDFIQDFLKGETALRTLETKHTIPKGAGPLILWRAGLTTTVRPPRDYKEAALVVDQFTNGDRSLSELKLGGRSIEWARKILIGAFGQDYAANKGVPISTYAVKSLATQAIVGSDKCIPDILNQTEPLVMHRTEKVTTLVGDEPDPDPLPEEELAPVKEVPTEEVPVNPVVAVAPVIGALLNKEVVPQVSLPAKETLPNWEAPAALNLYRLKFNGQTILIKASSEKEVLESLEVENLGSVPDLLDILLK